MKSYGIKIMLAILFIVVSLFLTNDLGVIKIEKTAMDVMGLSFTLHQTGIEYQSIRPSVQ